MTSGAWSGWPGWEGAHPLLVHFPVGWLVAAAACAAAALVLGGGRSLAWLRAAFALVAASAVAALLAVRSGEASASVVSLPAGGEPLLAVHERLGLTLLAGVWLLAGMLGTVLFAPPLQRWSGASTRRRRALLAALLVAALGIVALTAVTAHLGGRLVHELGVRAWERPAVPPR